MSVNRTISKDSTINPDNPSENKADGVNGTRRLIAWAAFVVMVPLLVVVCMIIYILIRYNVPHKAEPDPSLNLPGDHADAGAYFVEIDSARFVTISSFASTVVTLLPGFVMMLCSFHLAKMLGDATKEDRYGHLPTPYQLGLLIEVLNSQLISLWDLILYSHWKKITLTPALRMAIGSFVSALILSYTIWATDTWLHVVTESAVISQVTPLDAPTQSMGFEFKSECAGIHDDTMQLSETCKRLLYAVIDPAAQPYLIMNNLSNTYQVRRQFQDSGTFSYMAPGLPPANMDYQANTLAVSSQCEPYTTQCNVRAENTSAAVFNCSDKFHGTMTVKDAQKGTVCDISDCMKLFTDPNLNHTANMNTATPFYAVVKGNFVPTMLSFGSALGNDSEVFYNHGQYSFILRCAVSVQELAYSWVNGSMTASDLSPTTDDIRAMSSRFPRIGTVLVQMSNILQVAAVASNTSQEIADYYAGSLEALTLASSANFFQPAPSLKEQHRNAMLVTRVPKVPLLLLGSMCILFILLGLGLTLTVVLEHPTQYRDIQARLSIFGLAASRFEVGVGRRVTDMVDLFGEKKVGSSRVGITPTPEGGWDYFSGL